MGIRGWFFFFFFFFFEVDIVKGRNFSSKLLSFQSSFLRPCLGIGPILNFKTKVKNWEQIKREINK